MSCGVPARYCELSFCKREPPGRHEAVGLRARRTVRRCGGDSEASPCLWHSLPDFVEGFATIGMRPAKVFPSLPVGWPTALCSCESQDPMKQPQAQHGAVSLL